MKLDGIKAIVTGGASGLGKASSEALSAAGAHVWIADINDLEGARVARRAGMTFVDCDVTKDKDVDALLDAVEADGEPARVLINCAGMAPAMRLWDEDNDPHCMDAFEFILRTNITGTFLPLSRFAHRLYDAVPLGEERGVIINTASIAAFDGQAGRSAYAATKGAVRSMTLPLARELAHVGIRVNAIAPGLFDTPMVNHRPHEDTVGLGTQAPHPARLGRPDEFAALACHIIENTMINGEVLRLDAALRLTPW